MLDFATPQSPFMVDATRLADGAVVLLKGVQTARHPTEVNATTLLSSSLYIPDPRNPCMPVLDSLKDSEDEKDFHKTNILTDASPLLPIPFHSLLRSVRRGFKGPAQPSYTRTKQPVKYYIINFGLSIRHNSVDPPPLAMPVLGGDKSVPVYKGSDLSGDTANPAERSTMNHVVEGFEVLVASLLSPKLWSSVAKED
ncbi:hypothetical protein HDZ31DRAFT_66241 [Schizophyllum fasciatum]